METEPRPLHVRHMLGMGGGRSGEREGTGETTITSIWGMMWEPSRINSQGYTRVTLVRISSKGGYQSLEGHLL